MKNKKAFTLVELLVVIAVIGLISSIILVNLKGTREKARIAKALDFSHSIQHVLGAYAVGIWRFEETDNTALDSSGYGNDGTITGATHTNGILGSALSFDGNDWVQINGDVGLNGAMTIEFWFNTPNKNANQYFLDNRSPGTWWFIKNYTGGTCGTIPGNICFENRVMAKDSDWNINEWTHIVVTDDTSIIKMYINGKLVDTGSGQSTTISTNLRIGTRYTNSGYFQGKIDEVSVYNQMLTAAQIQEHYLAGLKRHLTYSK